MEKNIIKPSVLVTDSVRSMDPDLDQNPDPGSRKARKCTRKEKIKKSMVWRVRRSLFRARGFSLSMEILPMVAQEEIPYVANLNFFIKKRIIQSHLVV